MILVTQNKVNGRRDRTKLVDASTELNRAWRQAADLYKIGKLVGYQDSFSQYYDSVLELNRRNDDKSSNVSARQILPKKT